MFGGTVVLLLTVRNKEGVVELRESESTHTLLAMNQEFCSKSFISRYE